MNILSNLAINAKELLTLHTNKKITINYLVTELYKVIDLMKEHDEILAENLQTEINSLDFIIAMNYSDNRSKFTKSQKSEINRVIKKVFQIFSDIIMQSYTIIKFVLLDERNNLNRTTHYVYGKMVEGIKELQIVRCYNDTGFYLFYVYTNSGEVIY